MAICRSGAYLRRSLFLLFGRAFRGQTDAGLQTSPQKEWVFDRHSRFGRLLCDYTFMPRCQVPSSSLLGTRMGIRGEKGAIKVKWLPAWRPGGKAASHCEQAIGVSDQRLSRNESCGQPQTPRDSLPGL